MLSYKSILKTLFNYSLHLIFPVSCPVCSRPAVIICNDCLKKLFSEKNIIVRDFEPGNFKVFSAALYYDDIKKVIVAMKYSGCRALCKYLGTETAKLFKPPEVDLLVPVPLHKDSTRTFNQSSELAKYMGNFWGIKCFEVAQWKNTVSRQAGLSVTDRISMISDVFLITKDITGLKIALVDDVCTTGTTLIRLARACREAGAIVEYAYTVCSV